MKYLGCKIDYKAIKFQLNICIHYQSWLCGVPGLWSRYNRPQ